MAANEIKHDRFVRNEQARAEVDARIAAAKASTEAWRSETDQPKAT